MSRIALGRTAGLRLIRWVRFRTRQLKNMLKVSESPLMGVDTYLHKYNATLLYNPQANNLNSET